MGANHLYISSPVSTQCVCVCVSVTVCMLHLCKTVCVGGFHNSVETELQKKLLPLVNLLLPLEHPVPTHDATERVSYFS